MANPNSNSPASAMPVVISSLDTSLVDQKLRIAGISLSYDYEYQVLLVHDGRSHACLVDTSLVLEALIKSPLLCESKMVVMVIGYLERVKDGSLPIPVIPAFVDAPVIDPSLVVRAILISPQPDLNMQEWEQAIKSVREADDEFPRT